MSATELPSPPPLPPNMPAEIQFQYELAKWSTGTLYSKLEELRGDVKAIDADLDEGKGGGAAALFAWIERKVPQPIQTAAAIGIVQLGLAWGGALFERYTGHPPPQTTIPVVERGGAGMLGAASSPAVAAE